MKSFNRMRSRIFALSLIALFSVLFSGLQAQSSCSVKPATVRPYGSGQAQMAAYKINFSNALHAGSVQYSEIHRLKLIEFMERVLQKIPYQAALAQGDSLEDNQRTPAENLARQREILDSLKPLHIVNAATIATAKEKLCLVDEFEAIMRKTLPEAH
jgi:hypothetical protein